MKGWISLSHCRKSAESLWCWNYQSIVQSSVMEIFLSSKHVYYQLNKVSMDVL